MGKVFKFNTPSSAPVIVDNSAAVAAAEAEEERKKAQERQRRGLESNIKTSYTGLLDEQNLEFKRKKLLGE